MKSTLILLLSVSVFSLTACAQKDTTIKDPATTFDYELVVGEMQIPWGMAFLPDGSMLITEKSGELIHFKDGQKQLITGVPEVYQRGQGGLLDIELHPNYIQNGWIYLSYASPEGAGDGGHTALMRAKLDGNQLTEQEVLYKATPNTTKGCLLYTSDAADDLLCVDLGGRRIIK